MLVYGSPAFVDHEREYGLPLHPGMTEEFEFHRVKAAEPVSVGPFTVTGVRVDHYAEINLAGFVELTEALGGVPVCLNEPVRDSDIETGAGLGSAAAPGATGPDDGTSGGTRDGAEGGPLDTQDETDADGTDADGTDADGTDADGSDADGTDA